MDYSRVLQNLPVIPDVAAKILNMAEGAKEFSFQELETTIAVDPALTAKVLRVANSALYARQKEISKLSTAITLLGFNAIRSLVILVSGANLFDKYKQYSFYKNFWRHSLRSAFISRDLAKLSGKKEIAEQAFVAGLLHNFGQAALFSSDPKAYEGLLKKNSPLEKRLSLLEEAQFGVNHHEVGYRILNQWSFPDVYSDVAREHGNINITTSHKIVVIVVTVASALAHQWDSKKLVLEDLEVFLPYLGLNRPALETWLLGYQKTLPEDKMFQECQGLFTT